MADVSAFRSYDDQQNLLAGAPLRRNQQAFRQFVHTVSPDPMPSRTEFYVNNMANNAYQSYQDGFTRYFETMKNKPSMGVFMTALTLGLGIMFSAFRKHKWLIEAGVLIGLLGYPIAAFVRHFPKMTDSYELVKEGEPSKARQEFKKSFNELIYNVFHVYLKPLSMSLLVVFPLINLRGTMHWLRDLIPKVKKTNMMNPFVDTLKKALDNVADLSLVKAVDDRIAKPLDKWGDGIVQKLYNAFPRFKKYLDRKPT